MPNAFTQDYANIERSFTSVKSVNEFDQAEVRNIVAAVLKPSLREQYITLTFHRAALNIETLLLLKNTQHFQAIATLARAVFELAVEIKLIGTVPDAIRKIEVFTKAEKLRSAKKIVAFKTNHPDARIAIETCQQFIFDHEQEISNEQRRTWPNASKGVSHWSEMTLSDRADKVGSPLNDLYNLHYPQLSWYSHSGITGVVNVSGPALSMLSGVAFTIAVEAYVQILDMIIDEFKITRGDPKIKSKLIYSKMLPFTEGVAQQQQLATELGI
jgi:hypothetical protein